MFSLAQPLRFEKTSTYVLYVQHTALVLWYVKNLLSLSLKIRRLMGQLLYLHGISNGPSIFLLSKLQ
jgi:hypothetical protein